MVDVDEKATGRSGKGQKVAESTQPEVEFGRIPAAGGGR